MLVERSLSKVSVRSDVITLLTDYMQLVVAEAVNRSITQAQEELTFQIHQTREESLQRGEKVLDGDDLIQYIQKECERIQITDKHLDAVIQGLLYDFT